MEKLRRLIIRIVDTRGQVIKDANLTLTPDVEEKKMPILYSFEIESNLYKITFNSTRQVWIGSLEVEARGFLTVIEKIHVDEAESYLEVILPSSTYKDFFIIGGRKIFVEDAPNEKLIILKENLRPLEEMESFLKEEGRIEIRKKIQDNIFRVHSDINNFAQKIRQKDSESKVEKVLENAFYLGNKTPVFALDSITVRLLDPNDFHKIEQLIQKFGNYKITREHLLPELVYIHLIAPKKKQMLEMIGQIAESGLVKEAHPSFIFPFDFDSPIYPTDVLRPIQWHLDLMRLPWAWELLKAKKVNLTYGSADITIAIHDGGIQTAAPPAAGPVPPVGGVPGVAALPSHPDMAGTVDGGIISGIIGNNNKVQIQHNFQHSNNPPVIGSLMVPNNNPRNGEHGIWVSGVATAGTGGNTGIVGVAPNVRLGSFIRLNPRVDAITGHTFRYMSGLNPGWMPDGVNYLANQLFPIPLGLGGGVGKGAIAINCSHAIGLGVPLGGFRSALQQITLFARNRKGVGVFASAGNFDQDQRIDRAWGSDVNVMRVTASTINHIGDEIPAPWSNWANGVVDPAADFCAPSHVENRQVFISPTFVPPLLNTIISNSPVGIGNIAGTITATATIQNSPVAGTTDMLLLAVDMVKFPVGTKVIIQDQADIEKTDVGTLIVCPIANTVRLNKPLRFSYGATARIISGSLDYTHGFGGTSASTPMATGIAALILSANDNLTIFEARDIMRRTADPIAVNYKGQNNSRRWIELGVPNNDLITADGVLDIRAGITNSNAALNRGDTIINVVSSVNFSARQAILIGAESFLSVNAPDAGNPNQITVNRSTEFEIGDVIFLGKKINTVLSMPSLAIAPGPNAGVMDVLDPEGIAVNDVLSVGGGGETVKVNAISYYNGLDDSLDARVQIAFTYNPTVANPVWTGKAIGSPVSLAAPQREGPFTIINKVGNILTLNNPVINIHAIGTYVHEQNTEIRCIRSILSATRIKVEPLWFNHPITNLPGVIHIVGGRRADYSFALGYGRLNAEEAVRMAIGFTHNERDLHIRNFIGDNGVNNMNAQPVHSPDLWISYNAATPPGLGYADQPPHQNPKTDISAPLFLGAGLNDLTVSGAYTGAGNGIYTVEIADGVASPNTYKVLKDGVQTIAPANIIAGAINIGEGVTVTFAALNGHSTGDKWQILVEPVINRFAHLRVNNRGTLDTFNRSTPGGLPVAVYRIFLAISDGLPIVEFIGNGVNDLSITSEYTGVNADLFTIRITNSGGTDKYQIARGLAPFGAPVNLPVANTNILLGDGVNIKFATQGGHSVNDLWVIRCHPQASKWINGDHCIERNPAVPFSLSTNKSGTWLMDEQPINQLGAGINIYKNIAWPEPNRPLRYGPGLVLPNRPLKIFLIGEVLPHDGALSGTTADKNNNFSYREMPFTSFFFREPSGDQDVKTFLEVDGLGTATSYPFKIFALSSAGTFTTENLEIFLEMEKSNAAPEVVTYKFQAGAWTKSPAGATWITLNPPVVTGTAGAASQEQWSVTFNASLSVNNTHSRVTIKSKLISSVVGDLVISEEFKIIPIYEKTLLPSQRFTPNAEADLTPKSHFFTDHGKIVQTASESFGPVNTDKANRFRTTALFKGVGGTDPQAYAVVDGFVVIQRDLANNDVVNLVLKPFQQPMLGFTPIKYFIYRGIKLTDYLKGTSNADEKLIRDQAGSIAFVSGLWTLHTDQNGVVPFESKALGYDPANQNGADLLDDLFFRQDPVFQFPKATRGELLGTFYTNAGANTFGFEIVLEEGEFQPDLAYVRKASHEIDVTGMPVGTNAEKFALRLKREEILNFMDPAAFFGLHRSDKGVITVDDGAGAKTNLQPDQMYTNVIDKFHTKNTLYLDIRNENGQSYNFYEKYDDGSGKALGIGLTNAALADQAYTSDSWPLIIQTRVSAANANDFDQVFIRLRKDYNKKPILYIEHGRPVTPVTKGRFIAGAELGAGATMTDPVGFRFSNHDLGAGNRIGSAWLLKLHYGLQLDAGNSPFPNAVPPTESYRDNLFGPLSLKLNWTGAFKFSWHAAQDKKFVDAGNLGFSHVVNRGLAIEDTAPSTDRIIFYATGKDIFNNTHAVFVPYKGLTGGVSKRNSFFEEALLFDGYALNYDLIEDGGVQIKSLALAPANIHPRPVESMLVLGLAKTEYDTLKGLAGLKADYPRNVQLEELAGSPFTVNGKTYRKFKAGVRGLNNDGLHHTAFPGVAIHVFSVDDLFFHSKVFSDLQALPTTYNRNYEESFGAENRTGPKYVIKTVVPATNTISIQGKNLQYEIVPGDKVVIKNSDSNNGTYDVTAVNWNGNDTEIVVNQAIPSDAGRLGDMYEPGKSYEDFFIAKDIQPVLNGTQPMPTIVQDFVNAVTAATNNAAGLASLTTAVNTYGLQAWNRARELCYNNASEYADDRILYWARIKMLVALKGHPQVLKSISERNKLVNLLEDKSRGIDSVNIPAAGIKVIISGADPFQLGKSILAHNPAGSVALALSGRSFTRTVNGNPVTFQVESVVLPVRYRDFDRKGGLGIIEDVFEKHINPGAAGYKAVDLALVLFRNLERTFTVDRFAAKNRGGISDNENRPSPPGNPSFKMPTAVDGAEFYESSLPVNKIVPASNPGTNGFDVIFDNAFRYTWTDATGVSHSAFFLETSNAAGSAKAEDGAHPKNALLNGLVPTSLTNMTNPKNTDIKSDYGSSINYLGNEKFYRILRLRAKYNAGLIAGLIGLPNIQTEGGEFIPGDNKSLIETFIEQIAKAVAP